MAGVGVEAWVYQHDKPPQLIYSYNATLSTIQGLVDINKTTEIQAK